MMEQLRATVSKWADSEATAEDAAEVLGLIGNISAEDALGLKITPAVVAVLRKGSHATDSRTVAQLIAVLARLVKLGEPIAAVFEKELLPNVTDLITADLPEEVLDAYADLFRCAFASFPHMGPRLVTAIAPVTMLLVGYTHVLWADSSSVIVTNIATHASEETLLSQCTPQLMRTLNTTLIAEEKNANAAIVQPILAFLEKLVSAAVDQAEKGGNSANSDRGGEASILDTILSCGFGNVMQVALSPTKYVGDLNDCKETIFAIAAKVIASSRRMPMVALPGTEQMLSSCIRLFANPDTRADSLYGLLALLATKDPFAAAHCAAPHASLLSKLIIDFLAAAEVEEHGKDIKGDGAPPQLQDLTDFVCIAVGVASEPQRWIQHLAEGITLHPSLVSLRLAGVLLASLNAVQPLSVTMAGDDQSLATHAQHLLAFLQAEIGGIIGRHEQGKKADGTNSSDGEEDAEKKEAGNTDGSANISDDEAHNTKPSAMEQHAKMAAVCALLTSHMLSQHNSGKTYRGEPIDTFALAEDEAVTGLCEWIESCAGAITPHARYAAAALANAVQSKQLAVSVLRHGAIDILCETCKHLSDATRLSGLRASGTKVEQLKQEFLQKLRHGTCALLVNLSFTLDFAASGSPPRAASFSKFLEEHLEPKSELALAFDITKHIRTETIDKTQPELSGWSAFVVSAPDTTGDEKCQLAEAMLVAENIRTTIVPEKSPSSADTASLSDDPARIVHALRNSNVVFAVNSLGNLCSPLAHAITMLAIACRRPLAVLDVHHVRASWLKDLCSFSPVLDMKIESMAVFEEVVENVRNPVPTSSRLEPVDFADWPQLSASSATAVANTVDALAGVKGKPSASVHEDRARASVAPKEALHQVKTVVRTVVNQVDAADLVKECMGEFNKQMAEQHTEFNAIVAGLEAKVLSLDKKASHFKGIVETGFNILLGNETGEGINAASRPVAEGSTSSS